MRKFSIAKLEGKNMLKKLVSILSERIRKAIAL